jgi:hypothetical protein
MNELHKLEDRMRNWTICLVVGTLAVCLIQTAPAAEKETIDLAKTPSKVGDAVKAKFADAEITKVRTWKEEGETWYEVTIKQKGQSIDVVLKADGAISAVEKLLEAKDLPKSIAEALEAKYAKADFKKAEEITKGQDVTYEVKLEKDGKKITVSFDPKGKVLKEEAKDKK